MALHEQAHAYIKQTMNGEVSATKTRKRAMEMDNGTPMTILCNMLRDADDKVFPWARIGD